MKLIKFKIIPKSSFVSFPKGDMIFGHFANHLFINEKNNILKNYVEEKEPKIIFSDFLPDNYFYKPTLPLDSFFAKKEQQDLDKKAFKKTNWISLKNLQSGTLKECEELSFYKTNTIIRNSLNRLTFTTNDSGVFAPYPLQEIRFSKQPTLYVMFDENFTQKSITDILTKIGKSGFGKKSSIGKGQFEVELDKEFKDFEAIDTNYYLTISPTLLQNQKDIIENAHYNIFNRFGKYSNSSTPFKKPVLMADSGAVMQLKSKKEYIGRAIEDGINREKKSFVQGYSILVPFKFNGKGIN